MSSQSGRPGRSGGGTVSAGPVIAVIGGSGGVGASSFAAQLAVACGAALLVDLNVGGGGIDVLLGIEDAPGARWSGLGLSGGVLDADSLIGGLPRFGPCAVLAADTDELDPADVGQVLGVAAAVGCVVVDLPRWSCAARAAALLHTSFVVLVARADVVGLVGAHTVARCLPELPLGVVLRRSRVSAAAAADVVGAPLLGELPSVAAAVDAGRVPRAVGRLADGLLAGLAAPAARIAPASGDRVGTPGVMAS